MVWGYFWVMWILFIVRSACFTFNFEFTAGLRR
jgi:hypothetical protein